MAGTLSDQRYSYKFLVVFRFNNGSELLVTRKYIRASSHNILGIFAYQPSAMVGLRGKEVLPLSLFCDRAFVRDDDCRSLYLYAKKHLALTRIEEFTSRNGILFREFFTWLTNSHSDRTAYLQPTLEHLEPENL